MIRFGFNLSLVMLSLLVLGAGYVVWHIASKSEKIAKRVGRAIAIVMIGLSSITIIINCVVGAIIFVKLASMRAAHSAGEISRQKPVSKPQPPKVLP